MAVYNMDYKYTTVKVFTICYHYDIASGSDVTILIYGIISLPKAMPYD